jgi:hypothetical protein
MGPMSGHVYDERTNRSKLFGAGLLLVNGTFTHNPFQRLSLPHVPCDPAYMLTQVVSFAFS